MGGTQPAEAPATGEGRWALLRLALLFHAVIAALGLACSRPTHDAVDQEIERLRAWSLVAGARVVSSGPVRKGSWSVETTWEIEVDQAWLAYRSALERAAPAGYAPTGTATENALRLVKPVGDDRWHVDVVVVSPGPPLRVRVTFAGRAG